MMDVVELTTLALSLLLALAGAVVAWTSANAVRRVAGGVLAFMGALAVLATLEAPAAALTAALAVAAAFLLVGAALTVRLQEAYASTDAGEVDAADAGDDAGPRT